MRATPESMTRYIGLEIEELIAGLEQARDAGLQTGGLLPIQMHPARRMNQRALSSIAAGDLEGALRAHETTGRVVSGFLRALEGTLGKGSKVPGDLVQDWRVRAQAILLDVARVVGRAGRIPMDLTGLTGLK